MTPGAKFSAKTSAFSISPRRTARPLSVFRLAVTLFLLALSSMKYWESTPFLSVDAPRPCSPLVGSSTLITSAPSHPKVRVQDVPASNWVRSTTRTPCRAPRCAAVVWPMAPGVRSSGISFLLVVMHYRRARCRSYGPTLSLLRDVVNAFALSSQGSSYASSSVRDGAAGSEKWPEPPRYSVRPEAVKRAARDPTQAPRKSPSDTAERSAAGGAGKRQLDTTILRAALCCVVRGNRIRLAESLSRDEVGLNALRDQECHHAFSTFLRQDLVRGDALPLQRPTDWGIVGIATHQDMVLLRRRQLRRHISDNLLPLLAHLPASRLEQQIAVGGVLDRALQPADLRLIGGNLRRQRRVLLLSLLILRLELVVFALGDAGREEERCHERQQQDAAFQTICHCLEFPLLDDG